MGCKIFYLSLLFSLFSPTSSLLPKADFTEGAVFFWVGFISIVMIQGSLNTLILLMFQTRFGHGTSSRWRQVVWFGFPYSGLIYSLSCGVYQWLSTSTTGLDHSALIWTTVFHLILMFYGAYYMASWAKLEP